MNNAIPLLFSGLCFQSILMCEVKLLSHLAVGVGADAVSGIRYSPNPCKLQIEDIRLFPSLPTECFLSHPSPSTFSLFPLQQLYFFLPTFLKLFSSAICRFILAVLAPMCWGSGEMGNRQVKTCQRSIFAAALLCREPPASTPLSRQKSHFTLLRSPLSASHTVLC